MMWRAILTFGFVCVMGASSPAFSQGDPAQGEALFRPCAACHMIGDGAVSRVGPHLNALIGRPVGALPDYRYSPVLQDAGAEGALWDETALDRFLESPRDYFPGTRMAYRGMRDAQERLDLIAYMISEGGLADGEVTASEGETDPEIAAILEITGDPAYGQYLSSECTACHRPSGGDDIPSIAGLAPSAFIHGIVAYRNGSREHGVMNTVAARLGDEEIAALAAYFEGVE